jgi:tRNA(Ile)-lysidine synthase
MSSEVDGGSGAAGPVDPDIAVVLDAVRASEIASTLGAVVALVSGGRDSVCLLDALVTVRGPAAIVALHVNYGLRGGESDGDERHVGDLCQRLGVECVIERAGAPAAGNLQAWARDLRYGVAARLAGERDGLVATGHTASDQIECVLYRLAASPGRRALLGMAARDGRLVRPLLSLGREQTAAYCRARGLDWREDATNADPRFARSRVRHGLLEQLRRVHPAAEANVLHSIELLREEAAVLEELVAATLASRDAIALAELAELPPALRRLVVVRLAEAAAGAYVPGVGARVSELCALGARGGSATLDVGAGVRAVVEYGVLRFERTDASRPDAPGTVMLQLPGSARFGAWTLGGELCERPERTLLEAMFADPAVAVLDADALADRELAVRSWRVGDRLEPIGLRGSATLADLFASRHVPRAERKQVPVVASGGQIAWVPGVATSARFGVAAATVRVAVLSAQQGAPAAR